MDNKIILTTDEITNLCFIIALQYCSEDSIPTPFEIKEDVKQWLYENKEINK